MKPNEKIAATRTPDGGEMVLYRHDRDFSIMINGQDLMHSRQHESELDGRQGNHRYDGIAQGVLEKDASRPQPLGQCRVHFLLIRSNYRYPPVYSLGILPVQVQSTDARSWHMRHGQPLQKQFVAYCDRRRIRYKSHSHAC